MMARAEDAMPGERSGTLQKETAPFGAVSSSINSPLDQRSTCSTSCTSTVCSGSAALRDSCTW